MAGFLDKAASSIAAEYTRYLDGDVFGKILFKNLCMNTLSVPGKDIHIPIGRYGDVSMPRKPKADALVCRDGQYLDIEIKHARINIANRTRGDTGENWAFQGLMKTPRGERKKYDIAVTIGSMTLGLEDPQYWSHLAARLKELTLRGLHVSPDSLPHEPPYLYLCGFFIIPFAQLSNNYFRVTVSTIEQNAYRPFFAWGHDSNRCVELWNAAIKSCS